MMSSSFRSNVTSREHDSAFKYVTQVTSQLSHLSPREDQDKDHKPYDPPSPLPQQEVDPSQEYTLNSSYQLNHTYHPAVTSHPQEQALALTTKKNNITPLREPRNSSSPNSDSLKLPAPPTSTTPGSISSPSSSILSVSPASTYSRSSSYYSSSPSPEMNSALVGASNRSVISPPRSSLSLREPPPLVGIKLFMWLNLYAFLKSFLL